MFLNSLAIFPRPALFRSCSAGLPTTPRSQRGRPVHMILNLWVIIYTSSHIQEQMLNLYLAWRDTLRQRCCDAQRTLGDGDAPPPFPGRPLQPGEGSDGPGDDRPGTPSEGYDETCGSRPPNAGVTPSGGLAELRGWSAERMVSCLPARYTGSAAPSSSAPDSRNRALMVNSVRAKKRG